MRQAAARSSRWSAFRSLSNAPSQLVTCQSHELVSHQHRKFIDLSIQHADGFLNIIDVGYWSLIL
jgi:hypothetical protein